MAPQILKNSFGNKYLTISYDRENNWVYNYWSGMLSLENVMEGATEVLKFLKDTGCSMILNDNRTIIGSWDKANDWIEKEWMPEALTYGLRRFAHIVSPGIFGQASAEEMSVRAGDKFEMRLFKDLEEAQNWLRSNRMATSR
jgi:hypothetical protein